ncbi:hypothetical protein Tco_0951241 [Tanacetum coccineum]|uniref:Uncharacterized protein n=1 Tax=Tanacetum coccineum TaxID=301880 RepID=A0ABQ5DWB9_9ASTR
MQTRHKIYKKEKPWQIQTRDNWEKECGNGEKQTRRSGISAWQLREGLPSETKYLHNMASRSPINNPSSVPATATTYVVETTTTQTLVSSQNLNVGNCDEKQGRRIPGPTGIVQAAKLHKIADIREDEDFKHGLRVSAVEFVNANRGIWFSPKPSVHYLDITIRNLVKFFHKNTVLGNGSGVGGGGIFYQEALTYTLEEEARADQEWHDICRKEQELEEKHEKQLFRLYV